MDSYFEVVLDLFHLQLEGLVMAEIEQKCNLGFDSLILPDWFKIKGRIVSGDSRFENETLSRINASELKALITQ